MGLFFYLFCLFMLVIRTIKASASMRRRKNPALPCFSRAASRSRTSGNKGPCRPPHSYRKSSTSEGQGSEKTGRRVFDSGDALKRRKSKRRGE